jgi:hypothetical protein
MSPFTLDLEAIAKDAGLLAASGTTWSDADTPLHERGVSVAWLNEFARVVDRNWGVVVRHHQSQQSYSNVSTNVPWPDPLPFPADQEMTPAFIVPNVIKPLTAIIAGPLYALVAPEHRGRPEVFVSHAWSNPLTGSAFSTLPALASPLRGSPAHFVWIDVACYNQHRFECIAADMAAVVRSIGTVGIAMVNATPFSRLWCLWEILCAHIAETGIVVFEANGSAYDIGYLARVFMDEFKSVEQAETTLPEDCEQILNAMVSTFGSTREADRYLRELVLGMLSKDSDKPWKRKTVQR